MNDKRSRRERFDSTLIYERIFTDRVIDPVTGCWLWPYALSGRKRTGGGYAVIGFRYHGRHVSWSLHRLIAWLYLGYDGTSEREVCHRCNVKACLNPAHLYLATHDGNVKDAWNDGLVPIGEKRKQARLTDNQVREIRVLLRSGQSMERVARQFHVHAGTIQAIKDGRTWKHVGTEVLQ